VAVKDALPAPVAVGDAGPSIGKNIAGYYFTLNGEQYGGYPTRAEALREWKVETARKKTKDAEEKVTRCKTASQLSSAKLVLARCGAKITRILKVPAGGYEVYYTESSDAKDLSPVPLADEAFPKGQTPREKAGLTPQQWNEYIPKLRYQPSCVH